jgi:transposase
MQTITTIGFDIAKSVFQVHGVDAAGEVVKRAPKFLRDGK